MNRYRVFFEDGRTPIDVEADYFESSSSNSHWFDFLINDGDYSVAEFFGVRGVVNLANLVCAERRCAVYMDEMASISMEDIVRKIQETPDYLSRLNTRPTGADLGTSTVES